MTQERSVFDFIGELHDLMRRHGVRRIQGSGSGPPSIDIEDREVKIHHVSFLYDPGTIVKEAGGPVGDVPVPLNVSKVMSC